MQNQMMPTSTSTKAIPVTTVITQKMASIFPPYVEMFSGSDQFKALPFR